MIVALRLTFAAMTLVPAPQEYKTGEGVCRVEIDLPCPKFDWWDFDVRGACIDAMKVTRTRDASLPPEGYRLKVTPDGAEIAAADDAGAFYARQTLEQLAELSASNAIEIACCEIRDWPQYRWRGLLIDEGRHFLGRTAVKRILDEMAFHKLNVLHWHLTEDQGWRIEIKKHPELVKYGAVRSGSQTYGTHTRWLPPDKNPEDEVDGERYGPFFYTQEEVRGILAYAKARHITVVPEVELPGHCSALLAAHPELSCTGKVRREPYCHPIIAEDVICVGNDAALRLYEDVFDEICEMFPDSPFIHIGGDECPRVRWKECPKCQARIKAEGLGDEDGLQAWICAKMVRYLEEKGRRAVGWDEVLAGDVPVSTVGMTWRNSQKGGAGTHYVSATEAVMRGHDMVMAPSRLCYLSSQQFEKGDPYWYHMPWGKPLKLEQVYTFDPVADIPEAERGHVIGGQACVWGEYVRTIFDFEWKLWPRGCAIAETLWTAPKVRDFGEFRHRLNHHRLRLIEMGVNVAPIEMPVEVK